MRGRRKRWMLLGGVFGAGIGAVVVSALTLFAGVGVAAQTDKPSVKNPPTISGKPVEGEELQGNRGDWNNKPTDFDYQWRRCDNTGGSCSDIGGATDQKYKLGSADVGNTLRYEVTAKNGDGNTTATSVPTAVIQKKTATTTTTTTTTKSTTTTSSRGPGCPSGNGKPDQVANISGPARLNIDKLTSAPAVVTSGTSEVIVRFHVTSTCGGDVQGALVYGTATPFNQWTVPAEAATGPDGWAQMSLGRLTGFPVSSRQQLIAMFARARKPGEPILGGISTRRLFSIPVNLRS